MKYTILFLSFILCFSCSNKSDRLERALKLAGKNRIELEKTLTHYNINPADSLKHKAAVFLIENMPGKYSYDGKAIEKRKEALMYLTKEKDSIPLEMVLTANSFLNENAGRIYDIDVITSDYLIENIDMAYHQWKNIAWNKYLIFEDFCEYLLPYRLENEPLESWRAEYYHKYGKIIDSLYQGTDVIEAANLLNSYIGKTEKVVYNSEISYLCLGPGS